MEWEDFGIKGKFGKDYILKKMPSIERRYGNSETIETEKEKTHKEKIWNLTIGVQDISKISGSELGKCRETVKKRGKLESYIWKKKMSEVTGHELGKCND